MTIELIQATPKPIEMIAQIAGICYDKDPKDPEKTVNMLYLNGHHSVFEHIYFTFKITGISRACSHQFVRHRMCSFTQKSQRYCNEYDFNYVTPPKMNYYALEADMTSIQQWYDDYRDAGVPAEDARYILPNACVTGMYMSCNLRELIHIANERLCMRSQWEIRELAAKLVEAVPEELQFMLVPKCKSGRIICNSPCGECAHE